MAKSEPRWLITVTASSPLLDPDTDIGGFAGEKLLAVPQETRLELFGGDLVLHFKEDRFALFASTSLERFFYFPLLYFLVYRSRIHYNIFWPEIDATPPMIMPAREVVFALQRFVEVTRERTIGGTVDRFLEAVPTSIAIPVDELENVIRFCTPELYLALAYYILGCVNRRYFLVEFYKALEVIENALGGQARAIDVLREFGLEKSRFETLKRTANDYQRPYDIGRHAPKGGDVRSVDLRRLLEEPMSRRLFSESVTAVRQAIDAYFALLCGKNK